MRKGKALATKEGGKSTGELGGVGGGDEKRVNEAGPDHQRLLNQARGGGRILAAL